MITFYICNKCRFLLLPISLLLLQPGCSNSPPVESDAIKTGTIKTDVVHKTDSAHETKNHQDIKNDASLSEPVQNQKTQEGAPREDITPLGAPTAAVPAHKKPKLSKNAQDQTETLVNTLVFSSSAAKNIQASGNQGAQQQLEKARSLYNDYLQSKSGGEAAQNPELLQQAKRTFFEAARLAANKDLKTSAENNQFRHRLESTRALLSAAQRIVKEKNDQGKNIELMQHEKQLLEAEQAIKNGNPHKAQEIINVTFSSVKNTLIELRNGDTLVRSLNFASPQDEYDYELNRNDTHKMLLSVLIREKDPNLKSNPRVVEFLDKAADLRKQAQQSAHSTNFETAIKYLEQSTQQIIRAIRAAGIYIPG